MVPAHNEASVIDRTVRNLLEIQYPDYEILVVDDRSTDDTPRILRTLQDVFPDRFQYYSRASGTTPGKAAVLNEAQAHTSGSILCILDADAQVAPNFLTRAVPYFSEEAVAAVQARKTLLNHRQNWLTICQEYEYALDGYVQMRRNGSLGAVELRGNGMLVRRDVLESLGGWNEHSLTEDLDYTTRLHGAGWDVRYVPTLQVREEALPFFIPLMRQRIRWTEGSLIRYLENLRGMLFNNRACFRAKLDMTQFIFEFIAPIWLFLENVLLVSRWMTGQLPSQFVLFSPPALLVLSLYFIWAAYQGAYRFVDLSLFKAIGGTVITYLYLSLLWLPIVFWLLPRLLFRSTRNLQWDKTAHYGVALE